MVLLWRVGRPLKIFLIFKGWIKWFWDKEGPRLYHLLKPFLITSFVLSYWKKNLFLTKSVQVNSKIIYFIILNWKKNKLYHAKSKKLIP